MRQPKELSIFMKRAALRLMTDPDLKKHGRNCAQAVRAVRDSPDPHDLYRLELAREEWRRRHSKAAT